MVFEVKDNFKCCFNGVCKIIVQKSFSVCATKQN